MVRRIFLQRSQLVTTDAARAVQRKSPMWPDLFRARTLLRGHWVLLCLRSHACHIVGLRRV